MTASTNPVWAIGLDIGGTKMAGGLVRFPDASIVTLIRRPTAVHRGSEAVLQDAVLMARELYQAVPQDAICVGVGIGMPELVDPTGRLTSGCTIDWRAFDVSSAFAEFGSVSVESDVRAAASAEARFGAGQSSHLFVYVTVGTGISHAIVLEGVPLTGARGNALILASGAVSVRCPECGHLVRRVLESVASGPAVAATYRERSCRPDGIDAQEVIRRAAEGDVLAQEIVEGAAEELGSAIGWLVNVIDPEAVVMGGGLGCAEGMFGSCLHDAIRRHIWADNTRNLPILTARFRAEAGVVGAALSVCRRAGLPI